MRLLIEETTPGAAPTRVLLVDDQPIVGEATRRMLAGHDDIVLMHATRADEVFEAAAAIQPTVVLLDLKLPGVTGLELLHAILQHRLTTSVPVIILSSNEAARAKQAAFNMGASDYLVKLPDALEMVARLRAHSRAYVATRHRDALLIELRMARSDLKARNRQLDRLSRVDGLTGLFNRRSFDEALARAWRRATAKSGEPLSVVLVDVDHFKRYNDAIGHPAGDRCLCQVSAALSQAVRPGDMVARYGGEEFVALLPGAHSAAAFAIGERLRDAVRSLGHLHPDSPMGDIVTVSVGVATHPGGVKSESAEALTRCADTALYRAKAEGRDRVVAAPVFEATSSAA